MLNKPWMYRPMHVLQILITCDDGQRLNEARSLLEFGRPLVRSMSMMSCKGVSQCAGSPSNKMAAYNTNVIIKQDYG